MLQVRELTADAPWAARLRYAYADALLDLGRRDEAREWFARAADADEEAETDAAERLLDLDGVVLEEADEDEDPELALAIDARRNARTAPTRSRRRPRTAPTTTTTSRRRRRRRRRRRTTTTTTTTTTKTMTMTTTIDEDDLDDDDDDDETTTMTTTTSTTTRTTTTTTRTTDEDDDDLDERRGRRDDDAEAPNGGLRADRDRPGRRAAERADRRRRPGPRTPCDAEEPRAGRHGGQHERDRFERLAGGRVRPGDLRSRRRRVPGPRAHRRRCRRDQRPGACG